MRVDSFRDVTAGVAENTALSYLIGTGIIEQAGDRVPAVMGSVAIGPDAVHDGPPDSAVAAIGVGITGIICYEMVARTGHPSLDERRDAMMDGDDADAGGSFAPCDADIALSEMDVSFL